MRCSGLRSWGSISAHCGRPVRDRVDPSAGGALEPGGSWSARRGHGCTAGILDGHTVRCVPGGIAELRARPRERVHWRGHYRINGGSSYWGDCQVIDITVIGVGAELVEETDSDLVGRRITLVTEARLGVRQSVGLRLVGVIRNTVPLFHREGVRAGIELVHVSESDRAHLDDALRRLRPTSSGY